MDSEIRSLRKERADLGDAFGQKVTRLERRPGYLFCNLHIVLRLGINADDDCPAMPILKKPYSFRYYCYVHYLLRLISVMPQYLGCYYWLIRGKRQ